MSVPESSKRVRNNFSIIEMKKNTNDEKTICKIPEIFRKINKKIYSPDIIGFGLYNFEFSLLNDDIKKFSLESILENGNYLSKIINNENDVIKYYYSSNNVNNYRKKDLILDASFISLFVYEYRSINYEFNELLTLPDIYSQRIFILKDIMLLENQIPLSPIINILNILINNLNCDGLIDSSLLINNIIDIINPFQEKPEKPGNWGEDYKNIVKNININNSSHLLDHLYKIMTYKNSNKNSNTLYNQQCYTRSIIPSATNLIKVGIKFEHYFGNVMKIDFKNKIIKLPRIIIYNTTETILKNLMVYEITIKKRPYILQYSWLMDNLIDTIDDVNILIDNEIIINNIGDPIKIVDLWNNINTNFNIKIDNDFKYIFTEINEVYKNNFNRLFTEFKQKYFSKPWIIMSLIIGTLIASSTIISAVFAGLSLK